MGPEKKTIVGLFVFNTRYSSCRISRKDLQFVEKGRGQCVGLSSQKATKMIRNAPSGYQCPVFGLAGLYRGTLSRPQSNSDITL